MWASYQDLYHNIIIFKNNLIKILSIDKEEVTEQDIVKIDFKIKFLNYKSMIP